MSEDDRNASQIHEDEREKGAIGKISNEWELKGHWKRGGVRLRERERCRGIIEEDPRTVWLSALHELPPYEQGREVEDDC